MPVALFLQEYVLRVKCRVMPDNGCEVTKRYSDFAALDATLRSYGVDLPMPPKKVFGKMDSEFIERRQEGLQVVSILHPFYA
jgi:PX domain-containing protein kinase-like protein